MVYPISYFVLLLLLVLTTSAVGTDFFDDIFIPWTELPEGSELYESIPTLSHPVLTNTAPSEPSDNLWIWKEDDQAMYFDDNEMVRFRVISEEWHDQAPSKPVEAVEVPEGAEAVVAPPIHTKPPYTITGSMSGPGLGCCLWWE